MKERKQFRASPRDNGVKLKFN